jgi:hypothetical protein
MVQRAEAAHPVVDEGLALLRTLLHNPLREGLEEVGGQVLVCNDGVGDVVAFDVVVLQGVNYKVESVEALADKD